MISKVLGVLDRILSFIEGWSLFISTMAALLALFVNVVLRYGFNYSLAWSEELVREVIILTTFIGCSAAIKAGSMIKIDALAQVVPGLKTPLNLVNHLATLVFSTMMIYYGWQMAAMQIVTHQKTIIMQIPLVYLYALLPTMGIMMFIRTVQVTYQEIRKMRAETAETP
jgi:C4-dicarboxylate transporter, DctQ subunit